MTPRNRKFDDRCLLFFLKSPEKGKVKSRLARVIGDDSAINLYRNLVAQMLSTLKRSTFPFYICFYPRNAEKPIKDWLGREYRYTPQNGKDLGERMKNGFTEAFANGFRRVLLIGSDIPDLPLKFLDEAFASLEEEDAVIGPALDGGYYLIGFKDKTFSPRVFEGMAWGTRTVFEGTMKVLKESQQRVRTLEPLRDIDTIEDLEHLGIGTSLRK
jgi:rSAM/selenodomain-associated transferase 1